MAIYVYETTDPAKPVRRFEVKQSMNDAPLQTDPETGEPVRRVISGGFGLMKSGAGTSAGSSPASGSCGPSCGCH